MAVLNKDGSVSDGNWGPLSHPPGITMRDWFAGQAMAALLADHQLRIANTHDEMAHAAYDMADAMLEARKKGAK